MNLYDIVFDTEYYPKEYEIHKLRFNYATGWIFDKLGLTNTTVSDRARFMLCSMQTTHRIEYVYNAMIKGE